VITEAERSHLLRADEKHMQNFGRKTFRWGELLGETDIDMMTVLNEWCLAVKSMKMSCLNRQVRFNGGVCWGW